MNKNFYMAISLTAATIITVFSSGCSSTCKSWSPRNLWANRPRPFQSLFRGGRCDTCNPPQGRLTGFDSNSISNCADGTCGGGSEFPGVQDSGVPYYPSDTAPGPVFNGSIGTPGPTQTNYPPLYRGSETGSAVELELDSPTVGTNAEIVTPPMYGMKKFN